MSEWIYFARAELKPWVRQRKPIGWWPSDPALIPTAGADFLEWPGSVDVLVTMAAQELAWLANWRVDCSWTGIALSNEAAILVPEVDRNIRCQRPDRSFDACLSPMALGICSTVFVLQRLAVQASPFARTNTKAQLRKLQSFAELHPEYDGIREVLD